MTDTVAKKRGGRRKAALPDWREFLKPSEMLDLVALEENGAKLDEQRRRITKQVEAYRSRCIRRREKSLAQEAIARRQEAA